MNSIYTAQSIRMQWLKAQAEAEAAKSIAINSKGTDEYEAAKADFLMKKNAASALYLQYTEAEEAARAERKRQNNNYLANTAGNRKDVFSGKIGRR